jgi:hypothetical protein
VTEERLTELHNWAVHQSPTVEARMGELIAEIRRAWAVIEQLKRLLVQEKAEHDDHH